MGFRGLELKRVRFESFRIITAFKGQVWRLGLRLRLFGLRGSY